MNGAAEQTVIMRAGAYRKHEALGLWTWVAVGVLGAVALFFLLGRLDINSSHEARVAQTARQMAAVGWGWDAREIDVPRVDFVRQPDGNKFFQADPDKPPMRVNPWVVPVMNGEIRLEKPPLPYWLDAGLFRLMGVNELAARLPSAIFGLLSIFLIVDLGRRLLSARAGLWAGLVWVSTYFVITSFRKTMADPGLAFFTLLCLWSWVGACGDAVGLKRRNPAQAPGLNGQVPRPAAHCRWSSIFFILVFYFSLAMGALAKGPVILLHVVLAAGLFSLCYRRWPVGRWFWHVGGAVGFLVISLAWPWHVMHRLPNAWHLWRYESVGEFSDNVRNARPWWFYLPNIFLVAAPWTIFTVIGAAEVVKRVVRKRRASQATRPNNIGSVLERLRQPALFSLAWFVLTVIVFSFVNLKKNMYLLPVMPAVTLLSVQGIESVLGWVRLRRLRNPAVILQIGMAVAAIVVAALALSAIVRAPGWWAGLVIAVVSLGFAIVAIVAAIGLNVARWLFFDAAATALAIAIFIGFYTASRDNPRSPRPVVAAAQPLLSSGRAGVGRIDLPAEVSVYLPLDLPINAQSRHQLIFTRAPRRKVQAYQDKFPGKQIVSVQILRLPGISRSSPWSVVEVTTN